MVVLAGSLELGGAALMGVGALAILGATLVLGVVLVAVAVNTPRGLWASNGGYELPLVYALLAVGLGLTGPGRYSIDRVTGLGALLADRLGAQRSAAGGRASADPRNHTVRNAGDQATETCGRPSW